MCIIFSQIFIQVLSTIEKLPYPLFSLAVANRCESKELPLVLSLLAKSGHNLPQRAWPLEQN